MILLHTFILPLFIQMAATEGAIVPTEQQSADASSGLAGSINLAIVTGQMDYAHDSLFLQVSTDYALKPFYLQRTTYAAFLRMHEAAKQDGIELKIVSGARSFEEQRRIWEWKWGEAEKKQFNSDLEIATYILRFSLMPGTSRHHWGTEIDLNNINNSYFEKGYGLKVYAWLQENAADFGFCQVYDDKVASGRNGCNTEKWHWSYMPLSEQYLQIYNAGITYQDITGFSGAELAESLHIIEHYVNGVAATCHE